MKKVYICHPKRSAIGRFGGGLSQLRSDDLLAQVMKGVLSEAPNCDPSAIDDVFMGCANQAGEDNRNIARMSSLLAGLPVSVAGVTVNRLCASGMDAVGSAFRAVACGEMELAMAGGVESMTRAPYVIGKSEQAYGRGQVMEDTTMGWRFVNPALDKLYGTESMPEAAENVAQEYGIHREDQDLFAYGSQQKAHAAIQRGDFTQEITPITIPQRKGEDRVFAEDEHPRPDTRVEKLATLKAPFRQGGTVTAGNASGINDGAAAMLVASEKAVKEQQLRPIARILGLSVAGVEPGLMGIGPVPATQKLLTRLGLSYDDPKVTDGDNIRYDACVDLAHPAPADSGLYNTTLAGGLYGRILHKGSYEGLPGAYSFLFAEWLAQQDHELRDAPCFEQYLNRDPRRTKPENLKTEIYIPLQK